MTSDTSPGIGPEVVAELAYRLFDAEGTLVEEGQDAGTLEVLFGFAQVPEEVELALEGSRVGDVKTVTLAPERAFGPRRPDATLYVDREELGPHVAVGDELEAENSDGETVFLRVVELEEDGAVLDANHPLAGQEVRLEFRVVAARIATAAEVDAAEKACEETIPTDQAWVSASRLVRRRRQTEEQTEEVPSEH